MRKPVVFINEPMDKNGESHRLLEAADIKVRLGRSSWEHPGWVYTDEELIELCQDVDAVLGGSRERYTARFMEACPRLRMISKVGIGTERIDVEAATRLGIAVGHTPVPENYDSVAEFTIAAMLSLVKRLDDAQEHVRRQRWRDDTILTSTLFGRTVGLIGFGRIGRSVAARLAAWQTQILVYDPYLPPNEITAAGAQPVDLLTLLESADIVSIHVVITPETRHLIGEHELQRMKPTAYLVNTARGAAIDEAALERALRQGHIAGAAIDVTEPEPPADSSGLRQLDNLLLTPHIAGWTDQGHRAVCMAAAQNCLLGLRGETPVYVKNPEVLPAWRQRCSKIDAEELQK